ncbi:MAG: hypothetical protein GY786_12725 [Proteobacteria bacterium]|nr:hypothetical protein [Pseudomonadota bacterium]
MLRTTVSLTPVSTRGMATLKDIETRLKKLDSSYCEGTILACAGLIRAGYSHRINEYIDPEIIMPAVSQGIIGIEVLKNYKNVREILEKITHKNTMITAEAERSYLRVLEGGCHVPVACYSEIIDGRFIFSAMISSLNGQKTIYVKEEGELKNAEETAVRAAEKILRNGGDKILESIEEAG